MKEKNRNSKVRISIMMKILALALLPLLVLAVVSTVFSAKIIRQGMEEEAIKRLEDITEGVNQSLNALGEGDYRLHNEELYKGKINIFEKLSYLETFSEQSGIDITLFYDDVRRATTLIDKDTGERMVGTQAADYFRHSVRCSIFQKAWQSNPHRGKCY